MRKRGMSLLLSVPVLFACENPAGPGPVATGIPDVYAYVTGRALDALDEEGHFRLPVPAWPGSSPILSAEEATDLALAFIRIVGNSNEVNQDLSGNLILVPTKQVLEAWHRKPIQWEEVEPGFPIPYFAESHLEPVPDTLPQYLRNYVGPQYLVPMFVRGTQVATVAVAANAAGLWIDEGGLIRSPPGILRGNEFGAQGVPFDWLYGDPIPPEIAVKYVAEKTGAKVSEVPRLVTPGNRITAGFARWVIILDHEVSFQQATDGMPVSASMVHVSAHPISMESLAPESFTAIQIFIASADQPSFQETPYEVDGIWKVYRAPIRTGIPVLYNLVRPVK